MPHLQPGAEEGHHAGAHGARRARAGNLGDVHAHVALDDLGQMPQPLVERLDHRRVGALLGPEDVGRAGLAVHRVVYVAHGDHLDALERLVQAGHVNLLDVLQRPADGHEALARGVVEPDARGSGRTAAAVVRGAAAEADDELFWPRCGPRPLSARPRRR